MPADHISHTVIHPEGKTKIKHFHVFDLHWLYTTSWHTIVKVYVTERNDVTKRHGVVITIWQVSAIKVTAFSKPTFRN